MIFKLSVGELETALFVEGFEVISAMSKEILSFNNPIMKTQYKLILIKETKSV